MKLKKQSVLLFTFVFAFLAASCSDGSGSTSTSGSTSGSSSTSGESTLTAPSDVTATENSGCYNNIDITWMEIPGVSYYSLYYNTTNDTSSAKKLHDILTLYPYLSYNFSSFEVSESGTYYFWIKSANGENTSDFSPVASCTITYTKPFAPTDVEVSLDKTYANRINITWDDIIANYKTGEKIFRCYLIYYNTTNDSSSATKLTNKTNDFGYSSGYYSMTLTKSGTYYFWIKAANGYEDTDETSDFGNATKFEFTHEDLPAPVNLKAQDVGFAYLSWTAKGTSSGRKPYRYWVYYGTENDSAKAKKYSYASSYDFAMVDFVGGTFRYTTGETYYFWVKAADTDISNSDSETPTSDFSNVASYTYSE